MPTAPTGGEPSRLDPQLPDEEDAARRSHSRTTRNDDVPSPAPGETTAPPFRPPPPD